MSVQLKDCRLYTIGDPDLYVPELPKNIEFVDTIKLSPYTKIEDDMRIRYGMSLTGIRYLFYHASDGFKIIKLMSKEEVLLKDLL